MNIYNKWQKIRVHFLILSAIFVLVPCLKFVFKENVYEVFYASYFVNSIAITASCIILNLKHGFVWYYPFCIIFIVTMIMLIFFMNDIESGIVTVFLSYISASFVTSAIGGIMHKIRENNKEE